ncbi:MAG: HlyD family type I secretion periplasmic adaptor subunit [Geminicoccaceae bacterium]
MSSDRPMSSDVENQAGAVMVAADPKQSRQPVFGRPALVGLAIIAMFFGGLGAWSALAPLDSAAIAPGRVTVEGNRKTVQHLEGGIVAEIAVREGDRVEAGQRLVSLDRTIPSATLELLRGRHLETTALLARLVAERNGDPTITFPDILTKDQETPRIAAIRNGQVKIFETRRRSLAGQRAILLQQVAQFSEEIIGLEGQIAAEDEQLRLLADEIAGIGNLVEKGLARRPQLLALQRRAAEIGGSRSRNRAQIARARQGIAEAELRIVDLDQRQLAEVVQQHQDEQATLFDLAERMRAAEAVLQRTDITAPLAGTVVDLQVHTIGGVIGAGEALLDLVPSDDRLVILAEVDPGDIDVVRPGLSSKVQFSAFSQRDVDPIEGTVTSVSADRLIDQQSGDSYYLAKVEIPDGWQNALGDLSYQAA